MKGTKGGRKGYRNKSHQLDVIVRDKINCLAKLQVRVPWSNWLMEQHRNRPCPPRNLLPDPPITPGMTIF